ncbi:MAG: hypothetical protein AB1757_03125 [Acidobacteriota bacterium]
MSDATLTIQPEEAVEKQSFFQRYEFLAFSIVGFVAKSALLVRLPYREWYINAFWTSLIIGLFYCYFRFRVKAKPPAFIVFCLVFAIGIDVIGNVFHLYGREFFSIQYDEYTHFFGSAGSLVPVMWAFRTTTRRWGFYLPNDMVAFLSVCITFSLCAWYEILELWDELFWGDFTRLWTPRDTANDLQWNLSGIIVAAFIAFQIFKFIDRHAKAATLEA